MRVSTVLLSSAFALAAAPCLHAQVAKLDDMQFANVYYEISHIPDKREKPCSGDTVLLVARADKTHQVMLNGSCTLHKGGDTDWSFTAAPAKHHEDGRLRIPFLLLFHHPFYVYGFDPGAGWCVIGTPNHKQLWIYSTQPTLAPDALAAATAAAASAGFNTAKLASTAQAKAELSAPGATGR